MKYKEIPALKYTPEKFFQKSLQKVLTNYNMYGTIHTTGEILARTTKRETEIENMARFTAQRYTIVSCGRYEYKGVMFGRIGMV